MNNVKIIMKTIGAGPEPEHRWKPGDIRIVSEAEALQLVRAGAAVIAAAGKPEPLVETAAIIPSETRGKGKK